MEDTGWFCNINDCLTPIDGNTIFVDWDGSVLDVEVLNSDEFKVRICKGLE